MSETAARSVTSAASIRTTAFPRARRCVPPGVPVTITSSSCRASSERVKFWTSVSPPATVTSAVDER